MGIESRSSTLSSSRSRRHHPTREGVRLCCIWGTPRVHYFFTITIYIYYLHTVVYLLFLLLYTLLSQYSLARYLQSSLALRSNLPTTLKLHLWQFRHNKSREHVLHVLDSLDVHWCRNLPIQDHLTQKDEDFIVGHT